jgi:hypothetical protein
MYQEVVNSRTGQVLVRRATKAASIKSRTVGLLGKAGLDADEALIISPCWSIHTFFMRFPIDVLFLDKQGQVRKIIHSMPAWRMAAAWGAQDTIELAPGALRGIDLQIGDAIEVRPAAP